MANVVIVGVHVRDRGKAPNSCDPFFRCDNRSAQPKSDSFHPIRHQHTCKEIARCANGLQLSATVILRNTPIKRSHRTNSPVGEGRNNLSQIFWTDAYVAVGQNENFVPRLTRQPRQHIDLAICANSLRSDEKADPPLWKIRDEPLNQGHSWIRIISHTEKNFVLRIFLRTKACKILVRAKIHATHRLEQANRRSIRKDLSRPLAHEKSQSRKRRCDVISERRGGNNQNEKTPTRQRNSKKRSRQPAHLTPRARRSGPASPVFASATGSSSR